MAHLFTSFNLLNLYSFGRWSGIFSVAIGLLLGVFTQVHIAQVNVDA
ncbi:hypothetical protein [Pseudoalteromonas sp. MMG005]|nr:hypothetical protein [Pseudoalteromonas sp. MMG005]MBQ4847722.1 hypothetical protein [Pseudoalteromonas sp. MMG005]